MKNIVWNLTLILFLQFFMFSSEAKIEKQSSIIQIVFNLFQNKEKNKLDTQSSLKKINSKIKKAVKGKLPHPKYYRKISSQKIQKDLKNHLENISYICNIGQLKTPEEKLNIFKNRTVELRKYLKKIINSYQVQIKHQAMASNIYDHINENNFQLLEIVSENISLEDKKTLLEVTFKSYYLYYNNQNKHDVNYEKWAKQILRAISCII